MTYGLDKYIKYDDPGHGWLKVPALELAELGIITKISSCSYIAGGFVFLEEDCDMAVFLRAKGWGPAEYQAFVEHKHEENTPIRTCEYYTLAGVARAIDKSSLLLQKGGV